MSGYIATAKSTDHGTPAEVWEAVKRTFKCRAVDVDPSASRRHQMVQARVQYFGGPRGIDGAKRHWLRSTLNQSPKGARVYNNPPYGREIPRWVERARLETESGNASGVIQLLPFRAANWFLDDILGGASALCCFRGRLVFLGSIDPYPVDSMAVLWGDEYREAFREAFSAYVPRAKVCRAESAKTAEAAGRKRRRIRWATLTRPLGVVIDLKQARAGREEMPWAFAS